MAAVVKTSSGEALLESPLIADEGSSDDISFSEDLGATCNMALGVLGPGVLSIPFALRSAGSLGGTLIFLLALALNTFTCVACLEACHFVIDRPKSFEAIAKEAFSNGDGFDDGDVVGAKRSSWAELFLQINIACILLGNLCGNLVAIQELAQVVASAAGVTSHDDTVQR